METGTTLLPHQANNPLHIAVSLGLPNFVRELVAQEPVLTLSHDEHGQTVLHSAAEKGHLSVVKELLNSKVGFDLCFMRDKDGFLPIHTAAQKGTVRVVKRLIRACFSTSVIHELTFKGDSILHLAVRFNSFAAIRLLVEAFGDVDELLNCQDAEGNTILHLAIARGEQQIVKFLVVKPWWADQWVNVNIVNKKGLTALDMLTKGEHRDLILEEVIKEASRITMAVELQSPAELSDCPQRNNIKAYTPLTGRSAVKFYIRMLFLVLIKIKPKTPLNDKYQETRNTLMIVNTLIATITLQAMVDPPMVFVQKSNEGVELKGPHSLFVDQLAPFSFCGFIACYYSFCAILLLLWFHIRSKSNIRIATWMTGCAFFSMGMAFYHALSLAVPSKPNSRQMMYNTLDGWYMALQFFLGILYLNFGYHVGCKLSVFKEMKKGTDEGPSRRAFQSHVHPREIRNTIGHLLVVSFVACMLLATVYGLGNRDLGREIVKVDTSHPPPS